MTNKIIYCTHCGNKMSVNVFARRITCDHCNQVTNISNNQESPVQFLEIDAETHEKLKWLSDKVGLNPSILIKPVINLLREIVDIILLLQGVK